MNYLKYLILIIFSFSVIFSEENTVDDNPKDKKTHGFKRTTEGLGVLDYHFTFSRIINNENNLFENQFNTSLEIFKDTPLILNNNKPNKVSYPYEIGGFRFFYSKELWEAGFSHLTYSEGPSEKPNRRRDYLNLRIVKFLKNKNLYYGLGSGFFINFFKDQFNYEAFNASTNIVGLPFIFGDMNSKSNELGLPLILKILYNFRNILVSFELRPNLVFGKMNFKREETSYNFNLPFKREDRDFNFIRYNLNLNPEIKYFLFDHFTIYSGLQYNYGLTSFERRNKDLFMTPRDAIISDLNFQEALKEQRYFKEFSFYFGARIYFGFQEIQDFFNSS